MSWHRKRRRWWFGTREMETVSSKVWHLYIFARCFSVCTISRKTRWDQLNYYNKTRNRVTAVACSQQRNENVAKRASRFFPRSIVLAIVVAMRLRAIWKSDPAALPLSFVDEDIRRAHLLKLIRLSELFQLDQERQTVALNLAWMRPLFPIWFIRLTECNYLVGSWSSGSRRPGGSNRRSLRVKGACRREFSTFYCLRPSYTDRYVAFESSGLIYFALYLAVRWILERSRSGILPSPGRDSGRYFICDIRSFMTINSLPWIFREFYSVCISTVRYIINNSLMCDKLLFRRV